GVAVTSTYPAKVEAPGPMARDTVVDTAVVPAQTTPATAARSTSSRGRDTRVRTAVVGAVLAVLISDPLPCSGVAATRRRGGRHGHLRVPLRRALVVRAEVQDGLPVDARRGVVGRLPGPRLRRDAHPRDGT